MAVPAEVDGAMSKPETLVDTHAHVQWPALAATVDEVLERARAAGVVRILTLGTTPETCRAALTLSETHPGLYVAVGLHPGDLPEDLDAAFEEIVSLCEHPRVVAIGETGLDYYYADGPPRERQIASFSRHLDLAERLRKPVCIHNREATHDVLRILEQYAGRLVPVLHCFTGDAETARHAVEMGCYVSFAGNATYPKLRDLLHVAAEIPEDRLLVETDSPFLAPQPVRGRRNEPAYIVYTYDALAASRGITRGELGRIVEANAQRLFGWAGVPKREEGEAA
ncbi:MAG TPA: TatD family hydrolase [Chloroflexota bacterium]|nr:TatD family hydrolase [Chloroflexota bacterium]